MMLSELTTVLSAILQKVSQSLSNQTINQISTDSRTIEENDIFKCLIGLKNGNFSVDSNTCSVFEESLINCKFKILHREDPIYFLKSSKNKTEIKNMVNAHIEDGVALTKFLYWIKNREINNLTEKKIEKKLEIFRKRSKNYLYPSFDTIAGSGPNGAIIHYRSDKYSNRSLKKMIYCYLTLVVNINGEPQM